MIEGIDFFNLEAEKYWEYTKGYDQEKKKREIMNYIISGDYIGAVKKDGHYMRFVKDVDGTMTWQGRSESVNGGYLNKIDKVPHLQNFFDKLPNGTVLLGEAYFPDMAGSKNVTTILGCKTDKAIERQKTHPLHYYIFDIWAYNGESYLNKAIEERIKTLNKIFEFTVLSGNPFIDIAKYERGDKLKELLEWARENDEEGIVITRANSAPDPGKRTARKTIKIKKELDTPIDVFLTGRYKMANRLYEGKYIESWEYWEENLTNAMLPVGRHYEEYKNGADIIPVKANYYKGIPGSLEIGVYKESTDEIVPIGWISGVSDEIKMSIKEFTSPYVKKPCLVNAMEIDNESGCLRHGKILEFRDDITWKDCTWEKIYG